MRETVVDVRRSLPALAGGDISELRDFLLEVSSGRVRASRVPPILYRLGRRVLGSGQLLLDDVIGDWLLKLVVANRDCTPGSAAALLALDDGPLLKVVAFRLRQVACQQYPHWAQMKTLRSHVRAALANELPQASELPVTLLRHDKLASDLVQRACAVVLSQPHAPPRNVVDVADALFETYFSHANEAQDVDAGGESPETIVARVHDAALHAEEARQAMDPELTQVVCQRVRGRSLKAIGEAQGGLAASTVHAKLMQAQNKLRKRFGALMTCRKTQELVLEALAAQGGG